MKDKKGFFYLFLAVLIFMLLNFLITFYSNNIYLIVGGIIVLSMVLAAILNKQLAENRLKSIESYISNLNHMDFSKYEGLDIPIGIQDELEQLANNIKENLKTQVEISTDIFHICEKLNAVSQESVASAETIASSVEVADSNTVEQAHMLSRTNELTHEILSSLKKVDEDMTDKIQFISNSITTAQKGIENIEYIEERINLSRDMTNRSSKQILKLKDYSDEIVGLIDLINSISKETNMLSLNASIEAARAGEHGKGFAIVAMEVGKLAKETEKVSSKIEQVIFTLKEEIDSITKFMEEDMEHADDNCSIMEETSREFESIVNILNTGKTTLEDIKDATGKHNLMIKEVTTNIDKVTSFAKEIAAHMEETTAQVIEQHSRSQYLQEVVDNIMDSVYKMQQFVAGKVMEEKMLKAADYIKNYVKDKAIDQKTIEKLLIDTGMDDIYITDSSGTVIYCSTKDAVGLNLYEVDKSFLALKEGNKDYVVTPIKVRVEDGKLFKFLTIVDENMQLYEVGLSLDSLLENM